MVSYYRALGKNLLEEIVMIVFSFHFVHQLEFSLREGEGLLRQAAVEGVDEAVALPINVCVWMLWLLALLFNSLIRTFRILS